MFSLLSWFLELVQHTLYPQSCGHLCVPSRQGSLPLPFRLGGSSKLGAAAGGHQGGGREESEKGLARSLRKRWEEGRKEWDIFPIFFWLWLVRFSLTPLSTVLWRYTFSKYSVDVLCAQLEVSWRVKNITFVSVYYTIQYCDSEGGSKFRHDGLRKKNDTDFVVRNSGKLATRVFVHANIASLILGNFFLVALYSIWREVRSWSKNVARMHAQEPNLHEGIHFVPPHLSSNAKKKIVSFSPAKRGRNWRRREQHFFGHGKQET